MSSGFGTEMRLLEFEIFPFFISYTDFVDDADAAPDVPSVCGNPDIQTFDTLKTVALLTSDVKKIRLRVSTTKPAVHVYTGPMSFLRFNPNLIVI